MHTTCTNRTTPVTTHMDGRHACTTITAHTYQTQYSTEYGKAHKCATHTPDYQPISKLLGTDENAALANFGMRTEVK